MSAIPVSVLTGFLGSGKTTVLNQLVRHSGADQLLVIINEFGEIGLDHLLVVETEDAIVELSNGCLCCTIRDDLVQTLRNALWRFARKGKPRFRRVVIETTGLADPAPIIHTLMVDPVLNRHYRLDSVLTTVDAVNGQGTLDRQVEAVKQAAVADRLLLTKADLADADAIAGLTARLRNLNPGAPIISVRDGVVDPAILFDTGAYDPGGKSAEVRQWLNAEAYAAPGDHDDHGHDVNRHDDRISAFCVTYDKPIAPAAFGAWIEMLLAIRGEDLLRVKGILNLAGEERPIVVHGVQHLFHPPVNLDRWPGEDRRTRLVFIARDIPRAAIEDTLIAFAGAGEPGRSRVGAPASTKEMDMAVFEIDDDFGRLVQSGA